MNFIHLAGHLGADPETRFTPNGQKVTTFRVAVNLRRNKEDVTIWYRVTLWGERWDRMLPYLKKGSGVLVAGELRKPELYTDRNGQQQISMEVWAEYVQFNPFGRGGQGQEGAPGYQSQAGASPSSNQAMGMGASQAFAEHESNMDVPPEFAAVGATHGTGSASPNAEDDLPF